MIITVHIPDAIATELSISGQEISLTALEGLVLEGYRHGVLTQFHVGRLLGMSRMQTEDFLAEHLPVYDYGPDELRGETEALAKYSNQSRSSSR